MFDLRKYKVLQKMQENQGLPAFAFQIEIFLYGKIDRKEKEPYGN